jgi:uncharacterized membrane protein YcaP (DUF421 family)
MEFPFEIIIRSVCIYLFILIAIRLFGKKEFSQLSIIDLVFILLISNSVQNAMVGPDVSLVGGLVAAGSLFLTNYLLKLLIYRSSTLNKFFQGEPIVLIHEGKVIEKNTRKQQISMDALELAVREHGVSKVEDVDLALLEVDGSITILSNNFQKHTKIKRRVHKSLSKM